MQTTTQIQLDVQQPEYIVVVHAMQQDEQTRYVAISMTEAGVAFTPPSGTLGVLAIRKPDGEPCFYDSANGEPAVTIEGSTATCLLVPEALQVAGDAPAALVLYNAQGARLSTFRFLLRIEPTPAPDETVTSSSYYSILTQQIADAIAAGELAQKVLDLTVSATTLPAGSEATVTKTEKGGVFNLAFGIPQGEAGAAGQAATVAVGTVTTLPAGSDATVTNSGTSGAAVFNFGIPKGEAGDGAIYETSALDSMDASDLAALHAQGYRAVKAVNGGTVTLHGLDEDGNLSWLGGNQPRGNLLDNGSFLVAQAGYGGMHGTAMYVADRWVGVGVASAAGVTGGGVSVTDESGGAAVVYQNFYSMEGGRATFFVNLTAAAGAARITIYSLASGSPVRISSSNCYVKNPIMITSALLPENAVCRVEIAPCVGASGGTAQIAYAGVYAGDYGFTSLPPWEPTNYSIEMIKCQYCYRRDWVSYQAYAPGTAFPGFSYPAPMRVNPTVNIYDETEKAGYIGMWGQQSAYKVASTPATKERLNCVLTETTPQTVVSCVYLVESIADL